LIVGTKDWDPGTWPKVTNMLNQPPVISVVMCVYNGEKYLREAVESILNQTFTDFEFIIIDDGSTDRTEEILDTYTDTRIVRINNLKQSGIAISLNKGVKAARGEYIARMDADDISLPERFQKQVAYLAAHQEIGVLGSNIDIIDENGNKDPTYTWHIGLPVDPEVIQWCLLFDNPIKHPTVIIRKSLLNDVGGYPEDVVSQDYGLWMRIIKRSKIAILNEVLFLFRWHNSNYSLFKGASHVFTMSRLAILEFAAKHSLTIGIVEDYPPPESQEYIFQYTKAIYPLYREFLKNISVNRELKVLIRKDAARRIFNLANWQRRSPRFWPFFVLACWLDISVLGHAWNLLLKRFTPARKLPKSHP
jgi:glycosyltransferase involved in cell wall biosynthesis